MNHANDNGPCKAVIKKHVDYLCIDCYVQGYCAKLSIQVVTDEELSDPEFRRDVILYAHNEPATDDEMLEHIDDIYHDYPGRVLNEDGDPIWLNMEEFDRPNINKWFRDVRRVRPDHDRPRIRKEAKERFRILATLLRIKHFHASKFWGVRSKISNQNEQQG